MRLDEIVVGARYRVNDSNPEMPVFYVGMEVVVSDIDTRQKHPITARPVEGARTWQCWRLSPSELSALAVTDEGTA